MPLAVLALSILCVRALPGQDVGGVPVPAVPDTVPPADSAAIGALAVDAATDDPAAADSAAVDPAAADTVPQQRRPAGHRPPLSHRLEGVEHREELALGEHRLLDADPEWIDVRINLAIATLNRQREGDTQAALSLLEQALAHGGPADEREAARVQQARTWILSYPWAWSDRSLEAVERAIDLGYPRQLLPVDPGLEAIRESERFRQIAAADPSTKASLR